MIDGCWIKLRIIVGEWEILSGYRGVCPRLKTQPWNAFTLSATWEC